MVNAQPKGLQHALESYAAVTLRDRFIAKMRLAIVVSNGCDELYRFHAMSVGQLIDQAENRYLYIIKH